MPRSGSTLLFNMLRLILKRKWPRLSSGWCDDIASLPAGDAFLIKTHALGRFYRWRARNSFYTYRDVRVAAVSNFRKFGHMPSVADIRGMIHQYLIAKQSCDLIFSYEDLTGRTAKVVSSLSETLATPVQAECIVEEVLGLAAISTSEGYSKDTLLHEGHRTGTQDDEWREVLPAGLVAEVNSQFGWWFAECGYAQA
jgi:hypothetical protein